MAGGAAEQSLLLNGTQTQTRPGVPAHSSVPKDPDEEDDYFNLQKVVRQNLLDRFKKAGVKAVFSGHYHRNAGGCHGGLDMVVSSAIGCQLGEDTHGVRVVVVTADDVIHRYHSLEQLRAGGMDEDLRKLLQA